MPGLPPSLARTFRTRWFAVCMHAGLWLLLFLTLASLRAGKPPPYREAVAYSLPSQSPAPVAKFEPLFLGNPWPRSGTDTNRASPFFTRYFVPPTPPAPPPPTTRKIEVTYQGYFQTPDAPKFAILKVADALVVTRVGGLVATNLYVFDANMQSVTLTNPAAQSHLVPLNIKKEIEVPIK